MRRCSSGSGPPEHDITGLLPELVLTRHAAGGPGQCGRAAPANLLCCGIESPLTCPLAVSVGLGVVLPAAAVLVGQVPAGPRIFTLTHNRLGERRVQL